MWIFLLILYFVEDTLKYFENMLGSLREYTRTKNYEKVKNRKTKLIN